MKILLLGSNGQLGTDILKDAKNRETDFQVRPLARKDLDLDVTDSIRSVIDGFEFDVLVNTTGYHKTDDVESNPDKAFRINAFAVKALAAVCARKGARFLHVSTDYVFDGIGDRPWSEDDPTRPLNIYGASKLMGEGLALATCRDTVVYRVASLFGTAGASGKGGNFVETMIRLARERGDISVIADQVMSPTATEDVARMILDGLSSRINHGVYHAVNSGRASWYEFATTIIERAGLPARVRPIPATEYPLPAMRPLFSVLDNRKLSDVIGGLPSWQDALDRYLIAKGHLDAG